MNFRTLALIVGVSLSVSACSMFGGGELKNLPAELRDVTAQLSVQKSWTMSIGGRANAVGLQPVIYSDSVFTASDNGVVTRINIDTGAVVWQTKLDAELSAGPGASASGVVVATKRGELIALDQNGVTKWKVPASSDVNVPPVVGDTLAIARSGDYKIQAFDINSGELKWSFQRPGPALSLRATSEMVISGGLVFVGMPGGKLYALGPDGSLRFEGVVANPKGTSELERVADVVGAPMFSNKYVCAAAYQGQITCFDLQNGSVRWSRPFSSVRGLTLDNTFVYSADARDTVYAFSADNGNNTWKQDELSFRRLSAPALIADALLVGDYQGVLHLLNRQDGRIVARLTTDGSPIVARPLAVSQGVLVQTSDGNLSLIRAGK